MSTIATTTSSLFCLCIRKLALNWDSNRIEELQNLLPGPLFTPIAQFLEAKQQFEWFLPALDVRELSERCFVLDPGTRQLDFGQTAVRAEPFLSKLDFFELCSKLALDEPTERVYRQMTETDQEKLENMDTREAVVWCRALELSPRRAILHYDDIALNCAECGYLPALERNLMKVRECQDTALLQRCALTAILHGHYHVANAIRIENFSSAFHYFFPDGHVPAHFFAQLLDRRKLRPEVGEQIAGELMDWLSKLDVQWLRRAITRDANIPAGVLQRFDSMYRECIDQRDYPCDYD